MVVAAEWEAWPVAVEDPKCLRDHLAVEDQEVADSAEAWATWEAVVVADAPTSICLPEAAGISIGPTPIDLKEAFHAFC